MTLPWAGSPQIPSAYGTASLQQATRSRFGSSILDCPGSESRIPARCTLVCHPYRSLAIVGELATPYK